MTHPLYFAEQPKGFVCPHCGAGPFQTRDAMRKHIFDQHISAAAICSPEVIPTPVEAAHHG